MKNDNGHKRGVSELTGNQNQILLTKGKRNDTGLNLQTVQDEKDVQPLDLTSLPIKQSKSSMNKTVGKKPLNLNHPNCGKMRPSHISVWD